MNRKNGKKRSIRESDRAERWRRTRKAYFLYFKSEEFGNEESLCKWEMNIGVGGERLFRVIN